jgi:2-keto-4-pentenoate hydratase
MSTPSPTTLAAGFLLDLWIRRARCAAIPADTRPTTRTEGYAVQTAMAAMQPHATLGWKIAATSAAGQAHIGVDGPLAGRLFADRVMPNGAEVTLDKNLMLVAEIEFAFRFAHSLLPRATPYPMDEVLDAVACVHPSIEVPDSRYDDFVTAGAPQLIADNACANLFVLGPRADDWRGFDYLNEEIKVTLNGQAVDSGFGRNVLGDPRAGLTWLVNELSAIGITCEQGQIVTTGTCRVPVTVKPGDRIDADFGVLGKVGCSFR